jgi:predicted Ser/Thr protein kinase
VVTGRYREPVEGTPFGRYQLLELLGRGGMGEVWRAYDTAMDRVVALKMLLPRFAQDPEFEKRLRREARAAASLDDPHVVPIHDVGEIDGRLYVTMRLISGHDLQTLLDAGPLDAERAVNIIEQIASALNDAHQAGLVHRDVKPSNILIARNDFAYLIDFGIARAVDDTGLTSAGTTVGTWAYMAPERFSAGEVKPSSDVYALACVLYQCLTGQLPYPGSTLEQVAVSHMVMPPPKPSAERTTVPTAMDQVIATGLAKLPADRYRTTVDMAAAARAAVTELLRQPGATRPTQPLGAAGPGAPVWPDSAPTQLRHANGTVPPTMPGWLGPPAGLPPPPAPPVPKGPGRRPVVLIAALAAVVLLIVAAGVFAALKLTRHTNPAAPAPSDTATAAPPAATAPPAAVPFTGTYRADFTAPTLIDGGPLDGAAPSTATWGVRSVCRLNGCVATATRVSGDGPAVSSLVFDEIGGSWLAVGIASDECRNAPAEIWEVFTLQQRPDGTLTGDYSGTASDTCSGIGTVTFTRTGDVDLNSLPDPAALPPRVVSPAEALHGRYHSTRTFPNGLPQLQGDYAVTTACLRTGDRCMSYFHSPSDFRPLVFGSGDWILNAASDGKCPDGVFNMETTGQYPLPQPQQDPIPLLTGHGHVVQTVSCAVNTDFDETFTRTGD